MDEQKYRVVFQGEIVPDTDLNQVKRNLAILFNVDMNEIHQLFSGKTFVLKENVSKEEAQNFIAQVEQMGALCKRVRMTENKTEPVKKNDVSTEDGNAIIERKNKIVSSKFELRFRLMFTGEIILGKELKEVKNNLSLFYMVKPDRLDGLFTGQPVTIKDKMDFWSAIAYWSRFSQCGAVAYIESQEVSEIVEEDPQKYKIVFGGELRVGQDLSMVKAAIASMLKIPANVVDKLFINEPVLARTNLTVEEAESFKKEFETTGALCQIIKITEKPLLQSTHEKKVSSVTVPNRDKSITQPTENSIEKRKKNRTESSVLNKGDEKPSENQIKQIVEVRDSQFTQSKPDFTKISSSKEIQQETISHSPSIKNQFVSGGTNVSGQLKRPTQPGKPHRSTQPLKPKERNNTVVIIGVIAALIAIFVIFKVMSSSGNEELQPTPAKQSTPSSTPNRQTVAESKPESPPSVGAKRGVLSEDTEIFQDSNNYFTIYLPVGGTVSNRTSGTHSRIVFDYPVNANVSITAQPMKGEWDPEEALKIKMDEIQSGKEKQLARFQVENFGLVNFNDLKGYEIILKENNQMAHVYALISPNKIFYAVSISTRGGAMQENHDILAESIRESLNY